MRTATYWWPTRAAASWGVFSLWWWACGPSQVSVLQAKQYALPARGHHRVCHTKTLVLWAVDVWLATQGRPTVLWEEVDVVRSQMALTFVCACAYDAGGVCRLTTVILYIMTSVWKTEKISNSTVIIHVHKQMYCSCRNCSVTAGRVILSYKLFRHGTCR